MTQEEVKSVEVGQKIKVNGVETEVTRLFDREAGDVGFLTCCDVEVIDPENPILGCHTWAPVPVVSEIVVNNHYEQNTFEKYQE